VDPDELGIALGPQLPARVLERADELLLLGVDADHGLAQGELQLDRGVEMGELGVAVGVARALERLAVGLEAVAQLVEQLADQPVTDHVPTLLQLGGQVAHAPRRPAQGALGIAPGRGLDERLEVGHKRRVTLDGALSAATRPADTAPRRSRLAQLPDPAPDRGPRRTGRPGHRSLAASSSRQRLGRQEQPSRPLGDGKADGPIPLPDGALAQHAPSMPAGGTPGEIR